MKLLLMAMDRDLNVLIFVPFLTVEGNVIGRMGEQDVNKSHSNIRELLVRRNRCKSYFPFFITANYVSVDVVPNWFGF